MSVGGVSGAGAAGAGAGGAGAAAVGGVSGAAAAPSVSSDPGGASGGGTSSKADSVGSEIGNPDSLPSMSTQDFCALRTQAATPTEESPELDLNKMLQWLMAVKLLEAMNKDGG